MEDTTFLLNPFEQEIVGHIFTLILLQGETEESTQKFPKIKNFREKILRIPWKIRLDFSLCILKNKHLLVWNGSA